KLNIHVIILDHRDHPVYQWYNHLLSFQVSVLGVIRVNTHRCVTHDGLGAGGGHHGITAVGITLDPIPEVIKLAGHLFMDHLLVGEGGECFRVPVDHPHTAVDQPF